MNEEQERMLRIDDEYELKEIQEAVANYWMGECSATLTAKLFDVDEDTCEDRPFTDLELAPRHEKEIREDHEKWLNLLKEDESFLSERIYRESAIKEVVHQQKKDFPYLSKEKKEGSKDD
jgi:hypothetical protein